MSQIRCKEMKLSLERCKNHTCINCSMHKNEGGLDNSHCMIKTCSTVSPGRWQLPRSWSCVSQQTCRQVVSWESSHRWMRGAPGESTIHSAAYLSPTTHCVVCACVLASKLNFSRARSSFLAVVAHACHSNPPGSWTRKTASLNSACTTS